jgi:hypothetical protein
MSSGIMTGHYLTSAMEATLQLQSPPPPSG